MFTEIRNSYILPETHEPEEIRHKLKYLGLIGPTIGIQVDINATPSGASFCDHNCRTITNGQVTGNYDCPAAITLHPGLSAKLLRPKEDIVADIQKVATGAVMANHSLINTRLDKYFDNFRIPQSIQQILKDTLSKREIEVNLFGGNPELHNSITDIIYQLKQRGFMVNFTTTGGRFMRDREFLERILYSKPNIMAVSADDFESPEQIDFLANCTPGEIIKLRSKIPFVHGQRRKAHEAAYVGNLARTHTEFPNILFNLVIHPGNIDRIEETIAALRRNYPSATINPFPAQSAFYGGEETFTKRHLLLLGICINDRINEHFTQAKLTRRLHYWLMLKSAIITFADEPQKRIRSMSGYSTWKCYETPGAGRYIQIAGNHLGCYWNRNTITQDKSLQIMEASDVANYLISDINQIATQTPNPCAGCNFPRLNFDIISTELGLNPQLVPIYLHLRKKYAGF